MATVTTRAGRRSSRPLIHDADAEAPVRALRITEVAPTTSSFLIAVAHLGDAAEAILAAGGVLATDQAQEGGELPAVRIPG